MTFASWLSAALVLALHVPAAPSESHVERAERAYTQGNYADAAEAFGAAYAQDPRPRYLYAQAQATRLADNCADAVDLYQEFIDVADDPKAIDAAKTNHDRCEEELATMPPPPPVVTAPTTDSTLVQDAPPHAPRRWYQDPIGGALVGTGGGLLVAGVVLSALASQRSDRARDASDEGGFESQLEGAKRMNATGIVLIGVGAAAAVAGVVRWAMVARR